MKTKRWIRYLKADSLRKIQNTCIWLIVFLVLFMLPLQAVYVVYGDARLHLPERLTIEEAATEVSLIIEPEFPIVGETTQITASGTWHNSCVPKFHNKTISSAFGGLDIAIQAMTPEEENCDDVITAWSITTPIVFEQSAGTTVQFTVANDKLENSSARNASTYFFVHDGITFQSSRPKVDEPIQITISGWTTSCEPTYQSHTITDQTIAIKIGVPERIEVCGQSVEEWSEELDIGPLPTGTYRVEAYVRMLNDQSFKLLHATTLTVGEPKYQIFIPIIKAEKELSRRQSCFDDTIAASDCY